ncbi:Aminopeptidase N [Orchesella cincta]|uniref:Aminopeptidase n=1 Tax=Orchesella cincta TaxID=48709 RepID=A0A1D2MTB7_ORCCI|nr:Aminopeptidase N [Orchesella cincta]
MFFRDDRFIPSSNEDKNVVKEWDQLPQKSISYRLPKVLKPVHYNVKILPILTTEGVNNATLYSAPGEVEIYVQCLEPVNNITLHSRVQNIYENLTQIIDLSTGEIVEIIKQDYDEIREFYIISLEHLLVSARKYLVKITFDSEVSLTRQDGLYRSHYVDVEHNTTKFLAVTQFAELNARAAFVCFDEPEFLATFNVTIGRHVSFSSVSNSPMISSQPIVGMDSWYWDTFAATVPMPTYLVAFIVSDYGSIESDLSQYEKSVRILAPKSNIQNGYANYSVNLAPLLLKTYEQLFQLDYAMEKMDLAAIYDFQHGAMEHYGLNTYLPENLLYHPMSDTEKSRFQLSQVVSHELAHQYFGNLVVPEWFTGFWLKEGFATYFSFVGMNYTTPEFEPLDLIGTNTIQAAMEIDVAGNSHPLQFTDKGNPHETADYNSVVLYLKGASMVRMMEGFLGWNVLLEGLQDSHSSVHQDNLFDTLTEYANSLDILPENYTVKMIMDKWTLESGFPIILVNGSSPSSNSSDVTISQVYYNGSSSSEWVVPLRILQEDVNSTQHLWLVPPNALTFQYNPNNWILLNSEATGYYRVVYDEQLSFHLLRQLESSHERIPTGSRSQLFDDYLTLAFNTDFVELEAALAFTKYLAKETKYSVWIPVLKHMNTYMKYFIGLLNLDALQVYWYPRVEAVITFIGIQQGNAEAGLSVIFRADLLDFACMLDMKFCVQYANQLFAEWSENPSQNNIPLDLRTLVYCTALRNGTSQIFDFAYKQFQDESDEKLKSQILNGLICSESLSDLARLLNEVIITPISDRNQAVSILATLASKPSGREALIHFIDENSDTMIDFFNGPLTIAAIVYEMSTYYCTVEQLNSFQAFLTRHSDIFMDPEVSWVVDLALETVRMNIQWVETYGQRMLTWFLNNSNM